jgi:hypothetical protein
MRLIAVEAIVYGPASRIEHLAPLGGGFGDARPRVDHQRRGS